MSIVAVAYRSVPIRPLAEHELEGLLFDARAFNAHCGVTGVLLYTQQHFFQYFEGPQASVELVRKRIVASSRHERIEVLFSGPAAERLFATWHMGLLQPPMSVFLRLAEADWEQQVSAHPALLRTSPGGVALAEAWRESGMGELPGAPRHP